MYCLNSVLLISVSIGFIVSTPYLNAESGVNRSPKNSTLPQISPKNCASVVQLVLQEPDGNVDNAAKELPLIAMEAGTGKLCDYLISAASNNQELLGAFDQWKAALEIILEVDVLPDPRFSFKYFITPVETRTGPQRASFALTQKFPWMGKLRLKGEKAQQEAYVLKARFDQILLDLILKVKKAYFEYAYLIRAIEITDEILDILRYVDSVARTGFSSGNVPYEDVIRAQVELGIVEDKLRSLKDLKKPLRAKLNATMNRPIESPVATPCSIPLLSLPVNEKEITTSMQENNPRLVAFDYISKSESIAARLAKKEFYPDFTLGIERIKTGRARNRGVSDSGKDPLIASISLNIPLWQSNRKAAVRKAQKRNLSAKEERRALEEYLLADLELSLYNYRDANRRLELYGKTLVPKSKEALGVIINAFATEKKNFIDLIEAERTLLELQLSHERALADQAIYLSEIESLSAQEWQVNIDQAMSTMSQQ